MIIQSLRLKNIRSYGEGPEGNGVTVRFEPGVNRIAGKNGHGKSTLIESLGYALFMTPPIYEEKFDAATYLLRTGKKAGEIEVTFSWEGREYRLERGLGGQNRCKSKVLLVEDGSTEAEGDEAVRAYLCRLFRFRNTERLSELFSKLVGVKQGRLAWPFDAKGKEAQLHFEPLLDVEIFRQCYDQLKPASNEFKELKHSRETALAAAAERIKQRADSPARVDSCRRELQALETKIAAATAEQAEADKQKTAEEQRETAYRDAQKALSAATQNSAAATQSREVAQQQLRESEQALATVRSVEPAFKEYTRAETNLRRLQAEQVQKAQLIKQRGEVERAKLQAEAKASAARGQLAEHRQQVENRGREATQLQASLSAGRRQLAGDADEFARLAQAVDEARTARQSVQLWIENLPGEVQRNATDGQQLLRSWQEIAAWDAAALTHARAEDERAERAARESAVTLAETRKHNETLAQQLEQIHGGVCPFLKERCKQFEPAKVQSDIAERQKLIEELARAHAAAAKAHKETRQRVETLARAEASITQRRETLEQQVERALARYEGLFPPGMRKMLAVLAGFAPLSNAPALSLAPAKVSRRSLTGTGAATADLIRDWLKTQQAFSDDATAHYRRLAPALDEKFHAFDARRDDRLKAERDLENQQTNLAKIAREIAQLEKKATQSQAETEQARADGARAELQAQELDTRLKPLANLDQDIAAHQQIKDQNAEGYGRYLGSKSTADKIDERRQAFRLAEQAEAKAAAELRQRTEAFEAVHGFDPAKLEVARRRAVEAELKVAQLQLLLKTANDELQKEQARFAEWEKARGDYQAVAAAHERLEACEELTETARKVLRDAAPLVSRHVCTRVAGRAQQIYNQLNDEPLELEWHSERYGLIISPGERRFAMLSGGEQTKLAVAMTLAMLQEFSDLKFCVFDEPTYGVDAESRQKLADAILKAPSAGDKGLEQMLIVSHDDAFEGKAGHVVLIRKTAAEGSVPL